MGLQITSTATKSNTKPWIKHTGIAVNFKHSMNEKMRTPYQFSRLKVSLFRCRMIPSVRVKRESDPEHWTGLVPSATLQVKMKLKLFDPNREGIYLYSAEDTLFLACICHLLTCRSRIKQTNNFTMLRNAEYVIPYVTILTLTHNMMRKKKQKTKKDLLGYDERT